MKLSELKDYLIRGNEINFRLPDGKRVAPHAHLTELGVTTKKYLDCGGKYREDHHISIQLLEADDTDHRLSPAKFLDIIAKTEQHIPLEDLEIMVEHQNDTVGIYRLEEGPEGMNLSSTEVACLASDNCGIPAKKQKIDLRDLGNKNELCCDINSGCC